MSTAPDRRQAKSTPSIPSRQIRTENQAIPSRQIKTGGDPESTEKDTIAWHFHRLDRVHEDWGWDKLRAPQWKDVLRHLVSLEGLTWASLKQQAGGRRAGTNHHSLELSALPNETRKRWAALRLDDFDTVFSLRISNTLRLYGVRDGRVLQFVWHDPHHGSKRGVCPTSK